MIIFCVVVFQSIRVELLFLKKKRSSPSYFKVITRTGEAVSTFWRSGVKTFAVWKPFVEEREWGLLLPSLWPQFLTSCQTSNERGGKKQTLLFSHGGMHRPRNAIEPAETEAALLLVASQFSRRSVCVRSKPFSRCDSCFFLPPPGGRVSHEAFYRGRIVDKHREADKGRPNGHRRYAHDGDFLGIGGSLASPQLFLPSPSSPWFFWSYICFKPPFK